jgi:hypothetical protein
MAGIGAHRPRLRVVRKRAAGGPPSPQPLDVKLFCTEVFERLEQQMVALEPQHQRLE